MAEKLFNIQEAADLLRLSVQQVEELVNEGRIPAFHLDGRYLRFRREDLVAYQRAVLWQGKETIERYTLRDGLHDFFYFNDFYLLSLALILLILFAILRT